jgi:hypothetical protein
MIDTITLSFTSESLNSYDPIHLVLGASIGFVAVVILIKKIIDKRNRK